MIIESIGFVQNTLSINIKTLNQSHKYFLSIIDALA